MKYRITAILGDSIIVKGCERLCDALEVRNELKRAGYRTIINQIR